METARAAARPGIRARAARRSGVTARAAVITLAVMAGWLASAHAFAPGEAVAAGAGAALAGAAPVGAPATVAITGITPAVLDSSLVCTLETRGLPDPPSRETLQSGLPSALVFGFSVLDASGRSVAGARAEIRIEPDLWEEVFLLRTPAFDRRVASLKEIEGILAHLSPIPVVPLRRLPGDASYRILVRLAVHPLAPSEIRRSRGLLTGDANLEDPDRREVSVGLESLLKFFLGDAGAEEWAAEASSGFFRRADLPRLTAPPAGEDR